MNESPPDFRRLAGALLCKIDQYLPPDPASINEIQDEALQACNSQRSIPMQTVLCNMIVATGARADSFDNLDPQTRARLKCIVTILKNRHNCQLNDIRITLQQILEDRAGELSQGHSAT